MGFELPNGKTARNLQDQVKFLSEKLKDLYAAFNESGLKKIEIVEELPEVGDPTVLYLLAKEDPEEGDYYDEYLWYDNQWELIGSTQIDLSDYMTLSTDQTASGVKTFTYGIKIDDTKLSRSSDFNGIEIENDKNLVLNGTIFPKYTNSKDLGSGSYAWKDLYLRGKQVLSNGSNSWEITNDPYNRITFDYGGSTRYYFQATEFFAPHVKPNANNTYDLGANGTAWKDLYLSGGVKFAVSSIYAFNNTENITFRIGSYDRFQMSGGGFWPILNNYYDFGSSTQRWKDVYIAGKISDGNNANYGLVIPNTSGWSANKTISTVVIKQHSVVCTNGTLTILTNYAQSATSGSTVSAACSVALSLKWNGYPAIYCSGTVVHYYDYADLTIKSAALGTINSDTITDY